VRCKTQPPAFEAARSWAAYQGSVRNAIQGLKFKKNLILGCCLAQHLKDLIKQYDWGVNWISPVPLGRKRLQQRGYNQAALLAQPLAYEIKKPYNPDIRRRVKETRSQVDLSLRERQRNVKDAFQADSKAVRGGRILIVDDVMTSGSTLATYAAALKNAGMKAVFGLTVARPVLPG